MSQRTNFIVTDIGLAKLGVALTEGSQVPLAFVSFGDNAYSGPKGYLPQTSQTGLVRELTRVPVVSGEVHQLSDAVQVSMAAYGTTPLAMWCNEIGLHFADGTLFAVGSDINGFFFINAGEERLVTIETGFSNIPVGTITLTETAPSFVFFATGEQLNYTIAVVRLAAGSFETEAAAALNTLTTLHGDA